MTGPREIAEPGDLALCRAVRRAVFIDEQNVPEAEEWDGLDPQARHWLILEAEVPVATMRVRVLDGIGKIERVCVMASHRGQGHGAALIRAALAALGDTPGVTEARLGAQLHAIPLYERFGFAVYGAPFTDGGMPHRHMARPLP